MPELPEVTALVQVFSQRATSLTVDRVEISAISALKTFDPAISAAAGALVLGWTRLGKHLVMNLVDTDGEQLFLVIHLSRGGWVRWRDDPPQRPSGLGSRGGGRGAGSALALRIVLAEVDNCVAALDVTEAGSQKRLAVHLVRSVNEVPSIARLGPDPLASDFDLASFRAVLKEAGRAQIKGVLRDQRRIAGVGNAYSDEILHAARMSPFAQCAALDDETTLRLYGALRTTLQSAVDAALATDPSSLKKEKRAGMAVHGRTGQPCAVCGDFIGEVRFSDSSLQYCPTCQTGGRTLADRRMSRLLK